MLRISVAISLQGVFTGQKKKKKKMLAQKFWVRPPALLKGTSPEA